MSHSVQIGTTGAAVVESLNKVLNAWSKQNQRDVEYLVTQHNLANNAPGHWLYDRNQLEHVGSQVDRVYLAGQVLGHCHSFHIVADLAAGLVETLGVSDDKEITLLTDGNTDEQLLCVWTVFLTIFFCFRSVCQH